MLSLGTVQDRDSPFDRAIRLLLRQGRIAAALSIAERATTVRISALHARGVGVRDVFREARGPVGADGIAEIQSVLRANHVAVVYHLLRDELITWTVTRKEIRAWRRTVRSRDLVATIEALRACGARPGCRGDAGLERVSNLMLRDWIERAPRDATLLIQPPAEVQAVPFAMLKTRHGEMLIERNSVATAPSLRAFTRAIRLDAERSRNGSALFAAASRPGGGRDPLPLAITEVSSASRFYTPAFVETHATRARFLEIAPSFSIIHFAGHVIVNEQQPLHSALVFDADDDDSQSALLHMHELDGQSFAQARLVVLSACETGRAPRPTMTVANALLSQSVPSVVYTSWPVADDAAAAFAVEFHRALAAGRTRADAVRVASLALQKRHSDRPDWWAAFALAGAPDSLVQSKE